MKFGQILGPEYKRERHRFHFLCFRRIMMHAKFASRPTAIQRVRCDASDRQPVPSVPSLLTTRRGGLVRLASFAALPLPLDALKMELSMWGQEADLYRRRANEALSHLLPPAPRLVGGRLALNPEFASELLATLPLSISALDAAQFAADVAALRASEIETYRAAGRCGHCGDATGAAALADRDWFDFLAYCYFKAASRQLRKSSSAATSSIATDTNTSGGNERPERVPWADEARLQLGAAVLRRVRERVDVEDAVEEGISPMRSGPYDALMGSSPDLDSARAGVKSLLRYFRDAGRGT
jgi:hypothetical protein